MTVSGEILSLMGGKDWLETVISARNFRPLKESYGHSKFTTGKTFVMGGIRFGYEERGGVRRVAEIKQYRYMPDKEYLYTQFDVYTRFWNRKLFSAATIEGPLDRAILNKMFHKVTNLYIHPFD